MRSGSLRLRLIAGGAAALAVALIVAGLGLSYLFERHVMRSLAAELEVDLRQAMGSIEIDASGRPLLRREPSDPHFVEPLSGLYWQLSTASGITRSRSLWDVTLPLVADELAPGELHLHRIAGPGGSNLLAVERSVFLKWKDGPTLVRLVFAADTARIVAARRAFVGDLIPALGLLGLVLAGAMWVQIGLGLKPLERMRDGIKAIREGSATALGGPVPTEVAPLVDEVNSLLAAQTLELDRSRGRAADLAHGLKTPLSALAADVRTLEEKGDLELAQRVKDVADAMRRHVDRELARARIRGNQRLGATTATPLRPLVETLKEIHMRSMGGGRLSYEFKIDSEARVAMDKADLAEVLGNLIENATRHAHARVRISALPDGRIAIEDDGPGIPAGLCEAVLERGRRLDERADGTGLGLAIVQEVLDAYGRKLRLETSSLGGLKASF